MFLRLSFDSCCIFSTERVTKQYSCVGLVVLTDVSNSNKTPIFYFIVLFIIVHLANILIFYSTHHIIIVLSHLISILLCVIISLQVASVYVNKRCFAMQSNQRTFFS